MFYNEIFFTVAILAQVCTSIHTTSETGYATRYIPTPRNEPPTCYALRKALRNVPPRNAHSIPPGHGHCLTSHDP